MFPLSNKTGDFDSDLEMCWAQVLYTQQIPYVHHPGEIYNPQTGQYYEPDFIINQDPDLLGEVKGSRDGRENKLKDLSNLTGLCGVYLLGPQFPSTRTQTPLERPFAHWQDTDLAPVILIPHRGFYRLSQVQDQQGFSSVQTYAKLSPEFKAHFPPLPFPHKTDFDTIPPSVLEFETTTTE